MRQRICNFHWNTAIALLLAATVLAGCGGGSVSMTMSSDPAIPASNSSSTPPAVVQAQSAGTTVNPAIATADNAFGLNLFQTLIAGATGNVAISPINVAMALQILYNGAAGTTQQAMVQTLQLGSLSTPDLNNANAALQASLLNPDPEVQIIVANSLWMHLGNNPVLASFTQTDQTYYGATVGELSGAPADVNAWAAAETNGLITNILPAGDYTSVVAVIANTIYFKGQWSTAFDPSQTATAQFTLGDGTQVSSQMMHQSGSYAYLQGSNFQAVSVPYGQGRFSMLIVLPNSPVSFSSFAAGITPEAISGWVSQSQMAQGSIALPKFTATYGVSLPPALSSLGMGIALCSSNMADFSALAPSVCVSDVEHKTVVEVDESGTVAAAGTTVTVGPTAIAAPLFTMTMDHPFFYAIRDDLTGELLFVGILVNPI
ncbi:MAG: serpin family protein [Steroidobacteraceae bacterium]